MFGNDKSKHSSPRSSNNSSDSHIDYIALAEQALASRNLDEAVHLFLLAFDTACKKDAGPEAADIEALRSAWDAACDMKDRSLAEHVFEKLEPYCSSEEVAECSERLQRLALDRLEEFGISREDLQEMADMVTDDFLEAAQIFHASPHTLIASAESSSTDATKDEESSAEGDSGSNTLAPISSTNKPARGMPGGNGISFSYRDLVGYSHAIDGMRARGIGVATDPKFTEFLTMLGRRHGIMSLPSFETMLFRAHSREDANKFMAATVGELGLPTVRMYMEESPQGYPLLCVAASPDIKLARLGHNGFEGPGVVVLEDIDLWGPPVGGYEDFDPFLLAQMSRGVREAMMMVRAAVENSDVTVMASMAFDSQLDDFFYSLLEPITPIDIEVPDDVERAEVWKHAATMYPSLRFIDRGDLVRLSKNMSREDIYLAARESVEQAYRQSVEKRSFVPVTRDNIFDKVAAYQPLDSKEYHELEDAAVRSWSIALENLDDLIKGEEE